MGTTDYTALAARCEEWLRNGRADQVGHILNKLVVANIPRSKRGQLANFARRASLIPLGLRILTPIFFDADAGVPDVRATAEEWAEMGVLLHKSGSTSEALKALEHARRGRIPEASLYTAFCHFSRWETEKAIEPLLEYVNAEGLSDYQRAVGMVNLTAAYAQLKLPEPALLHLEPTLKLTREKGFQRLTANLLDVSAQLDILAQQFDQAVEKLKSADAILMQDGSVDRLYIQKLLALIHLIRNQDAEPMRQVRSAAARLQHWETIRSCDIHLLKHQGNQALFERLYFGSPFPSLRGELSRDYSGIYHIPATYKMGQGADTLDIATGELNGKALFRTKRKLHDLCGVLFSDFYRPFRVGTLFAGVFPGDHYNILYGPDRIYHLMHRLRLEFAGAKAHITVEERNGFFRARAGRDCSILFHHGMNGKEASKLAPVLRLQNSFRHQAFSSQQAREALSMPHASMARLLQKAVQDGLLIKEGNGVYTRYRVAA